MKFVLNLQDMGADPELSGDDPLAASSVSVICSNGCCSSVSLLLCS